jgi:hypothetical protein
MTEALDPELLEKYPSLRKTLETGIEVRLSFRTQNTRNVDYTIGQ